MAISSKVVRKLWASSGGYCAKPDCHSELFQFFENGKVNSIEELAHIIGQQQSGPRGADKLPLTERDEFENIILLCPTCHTIIDKNPGSFPTDLIKEWKKHHENGIKNIFAIPKYNSRDEIKNHIKPILEENKMIFDKYGPFSQNAIDNQMSTELIWTELSIKKLLPNNRKLEQVIENNRDLLDASETKLFVDFKIHREGFEYNKISGDLNSAVPVFPKGFEKIFE